MGYSVATSSTAASTASAGVPVAEERGMKRLEKKLREISKLVERAAAGEQLDVLQHEKVKHKKEIEVELDTLRGLAESRARDMARRAAAWVWGGTGVLYRARWCVCPRAW